MFRDRVTWCFIALVLLRPVSVDATIRRVPTDYPTIQEAISLSADGDTVLVLPGVYREHVRLVSRDIVVRSQGGAAITTIDATGQSASVVYFSDCDERAQLDGFTLRGGMGTSEGPYHNCGGGIFVPDSRGQGPTIKNNLIVYNSTGQGGGLDLESSATVSHNLIAFNSAVLEGGGVLGRMPVGAAIPLAITDNEIFGNMVSGDAFPIGNGGGIYAAGNVRIARNIVACNEAREAGGILVSSSGGGMSLERNTVFANWGRNGVGGVYFLLSGTGLPVEFSANAVVFNLGGGVKCTAPGSSRIIAQCNDINGNNPDFINTDCGEAFAGNGNSSADPLFGQSSGCPPAEGDLCLSPDSPLLPEHSPPGCGLIGARGLCLPNAVSDLSSHLAGSLRALPARPNPFFKRTMIAFHLPTSSNVEISIYSVLGRKVRTLTGGALAAGNNEVEWDGRGDDGERAAAGAYVSVIRSGGTEVTRTLLLVR